jgi:hypothetical protein
MLLYIYTKEKDKKNTNVALVRQHGRKMTKEKGHLQHKKKYIKVFSIAFSAVI